MKHKAEIPAMHATRSAEEMKKAVQYSDEQTVSAVCTSCLASSSGIASKKWSSTSKDVGTKFSQS
jgi:hypothetical protein